MALVRRLKPRIYADTQGKEVIAFPPGYVPIQVNSRQLRGFIAHVFEREYGPREMLSEKAAKRVEMELTGEAIGSEGPVLEGPLDTFQDPDPLLLAVYHHMVKRHEDNLGSYTGFTTTIMNEVVKDAPKYGIPARLIPQYAHVFGSRLIALIPQLLVLGLKARYRHRNKGTYFEISWDAGQPEGESDDGDGPPSPTPSASKGNETKPLQRRDGRDVGELLSRIKALTPETKEPQP